MINKAFWCCLLPVMLFSASNTMDVHIEYGGGKPAKQTTVTYKSGANALDVLQKAAAVKTYRVGTYLFVRSIDDTAGVPGEMGWFFSIDGVRAKKTASSYILPEGSHLMSWVYQKQNCLSQQ